MDFDIHVEFNKYLKRMELNRHLMAKNEYLERKRVFIAGISQYHMYLTRDVAEIDDDKAAAKLLDAVEGQLSDFWNEQK